MTIQFQTTVLVPNIDAITALRPGDGGQTPWLYFLVERVLPTGGMDPRNAAYYLAVNNDDPNNAFLHPQTWAYLTPDYFFREMLTSNFLAPDYVDVAEFGRYATAYPYRNAAGIWTMALVMSLPVPAPPVRPSWSVLVPVPDIMQQVTRAARPSWYGQAILLQDNAGYTYRFETGSLVRAVLAKTLVPQLPYYSP